MVAKVIFFLIALAVVALLFVFAGKEAYEYFVEKPPDMLVELVTKTDPPPPLPEGERAPLSVPSGFVATIYSREVPGARVMVRDPKGTMLVSQTSEGTITALPDLDSNGLADSVNVILEGLDEPHGLLVHCPDTGSASADQDACRLYVAETDGLVSYRYDADTMRATEPETLTTFPHGEGHYTRTLHLHPDGKRILISVGSSCNVCNETDAKRAAVLTYDIASKQVTTMATGLRNTVFMATDPVTGEVWGTDNGRDMLGDDIPPDEVNILRDGKDYGWPICYGNNVHDASFDENGDAAACAGKEAAHIALQAHSAPLGIAFIPEEGWPEEMYNDVLVAYHGSWNRSVPTGYKVVRFDLDEERRAVGAPIDFLSGFLKEGGSADAAIGRPAGIMTEPGGVAYVSDDRAGAIYRITQRAE